MNSKKSRPTAFMTLLLSLLALYASLQGILDKTIYTDVFLAGSMAKNLIGGSIAQDIISIPTSVILIILSIFFLKYANEKIFIVILGLVGFFFMVMDSMPFKDSTQPFILSTWQFLDFPSTASYTAC